MHPAPPVDTYFHKRLEPPAYRIIHGAGQDAQAFHDYYRVMDTQPPVIYMTYWPLNMVSTYFGNQLQTALDSYTGDYLIPQIGLTMTADGHPEKHYEQDVAAGKYDAEIEMLCYQLQKLHRPVFLRIGYEFNGHWNGYHPKEFREAWIRIVTALRKHHLDEVATVWCYAPDDTRTDYMNFYPGDAYVDWWGIDLFSTEHFTKPSVEAFMAASLRHGFPVMIGESTPRAIGVLRGQQSWDRWFAPYFAFMQRHRNVKAFCYIAWDWSTYPPLANWGDARIGQNPVVLNNYRQELADPRYLHGGDAATVRRALGLSPTPPKLEITARAMSPLQIVRQFFQVLNYQFNLTLWHYLTGAVLVLSAIFGIKRLRKRRKNSSATP